MTLMENTCISYNPTLLVALVSICVLVFESVIKFIGYTLQMLTRFSSLKIPKKEIRSCDTKDRHNGKKTNNHLQSISQKTKDQVTRTALSNEGELRCSR